MSAAEGRGVRFDLALAALAFAGAAAFAWSNPPGEAPDEPDHLACVAYVAQHGRLPDQSQEATRVPEGHQYPLYYAIAGTVARLACGAESVAMSGPAGARAFASPCGRRVFPWLRLLGAICVALLVVETARASALLLPETARAYPPLLVATLPQLLFLGGAVSNDAMTAWLGAAALRAGLAAHAHPASLAGWARAGAWAGAAVLAKKSNLVVAAALAIPLLALAWRSRRLRPAIAPALCAAVPFLLLVGPILARNALLYGDLLGTRIELETLHASLRPRPLTAPYFRDAFVEWTATSYVARFGWMQIVVPAGVLAVHGVLLAAPLAAGLVRAAAAPSAAAAYLGAALLANVAALVHFNRFYPQPQGRLLFATLGAAALLAGFGAAPLLGRLAPRARRAVFAAAAAALVAVLGFCLWWNARYYALLEKATA
jgi:hypothetical protein